MFAAVDTVAVVVVRADVVTIFVAERFSDLSQTCSTKHLDFPNDFQELNNFGEREK